MFKKLTVLFTVLTIVTMLLVPIAYADATPQDFVYLDMSENKTWYTGDDATDVALKVYGVKVDGTRVDISDDIAAPVSDNEAVFYFNGWAVIEVRPHASDVAYISDGILTGSLETEDTSKTLTGAIGEGGSVTVNGEAFADGATVKLEEGDDINIAVTPNTGYEVDEVKLGETVLTLNASGAATATMPGEDVTLTVTFKAKTVTAPTIITDTSNNYFKTVDGKPTAFVYAKIGDYYDPSLNGGYGMNLWVDGNAITADNTYVFKPYVGETEGDEIKVSFTE